jgi:predicted phosphodiesterase
MTADIRIISAITLLIGILSMSSCNTVCPVNEAPTITSPLITEAAWGIEYRYAATYVDADDTANTVVYSNFPCWVTIDDGGLRGVPPQDATDAGFYVIVSDQFVADTAWVTIRITPLIAVYGDTRSDHTAHQQVANLIVAAEPAVVFHTGDLVNNGNNPGDWTIFNSIAGPLMTGAEYFPTLGNHEYQSQLYFDNFNLPNNEQWYSVERNKIHFIVLNTSVSIDEGSEQYRWLDSNLAAVSDTVEFIAAVFHYPPYSSGAHAEDEVGLRESIVPLFQQCGVDIVFNGHDHNYERLHCGGITYVVTGGGGAPLRGQARVTECSEIFLSTHHYCQVQRVGSRMYVRVYDLDSEVIDEFEIEKT